MNPSSSQFPKRMPSLFVMYEAMSNAESLRSSLETITRDAILCAESCAMVKVTSLSGMVAPSFTHEAAPLSVAMGMMVFPLLVRIVCAILRNTLISSCVSRSLR